MRALRITGKFRPFSYEEMVRPLEQATMAHREIEDAYGQLNMEANTVESMINSETDPESARRYQAYADNLRQQADNLAKYGLTPDSRRALNNMRSAYVSEIVPITNAYNQKMSDIKRQQEVSDKTGGKTIFTRDARTTSVDDYLLGRVTDYGQANLDDIYKEAATGAQAISSRYFNSKEGKNFRGMWQELVQTRGINPEEAARILADTGNYPQFNQLVNDLRNKYGYINYSGADKSRIDSSILGGLGAGMMYEEKRDIQSLLGWAQFNWEKQKYEQANKAALLEPDDSVGLYNMVSSRELTERQDELRKMGKYMENGVLSDDGLKKLLKKSFSKAPVNMNSLGIPTYLDYTRVNKPAGVIETPLGNIELQHMYASDEERYADIKRQYENLYNTALAVEEGNLYDTNLKGIIRLNIDESDLPPEFVSIVGDDAYIQDFDPETSSFYDTNKKYKYGKYKSVKFNQVLSDEHGRLVVKGIADNEPIMVKMNLENYSINQLQNISMAIADINELKAEAQYLSELERGTINEAEKALIQINRQNLEFQFRNALKVFKDSVFSGLRRNTVEKRKG